MLSSDKQKEFEDTELFKWFGKYKYTEEIRKIEQELDKGKDDYEYS